MHQRRRIILLFGFGIVLPSLLLGYLAFRGIQNDRALVEQRRLEGIRRAADQVVRAVDAGITSVEQALSAAVAGGAGLDDTETRSVLQKLAADHPLIEQVFLIQASRGLRFPAATPLYLTDGFRESAPSTAAERSPSAAFPAAQRLEFRDDDLPGALSAYREALRQAKEPLLAGLTMNAVARVQKKSGSLGEAVATYEAIVQDHGEIVIPGGMPLGPSAALEICALTRDLGDFPRSLQTAVRLYRSLLRRAWDLEKAEFELFIGRAKDHISALLQDPPAGLDVRTFRTEFQALAVEELGLRKLTERMLLFQGSASQALEPRLMAAASPDTTGRRFLRSSVEIGDASFLVTVARPARPGGGTPEPVWGLLVDADRLREDVLRPALLDPIVSGQATWSIKGKGGAALLSSADPPSGPVSLRTNFASDFPSWSLEFHQAPSRLIKAFLLSRRGLYFFIFLLIAGILVFGLVLTLRSVSHELELARMKSDFVSTVSHEFKSPLTSIRQLAEMLQSGRVPSEERRQKYYEILLEQSERLTLLTDNILSLAKIEEGRAEFTFERTDLPALLGDVVAAFRDRVRHEGFDIHFEVVDGLPPTAVDGAALSQALTNLLDNAVKYSGDSRSISVRVFREAEGIAVAVRDSGIGIKREDIPRLFERFFRAGDELTRTVKGSGLGLTLVKEIVEAHRGRIDIESEPGKGSVFTIRLPLPRREES